MTPDQLLPLVQQATHNQRAGWDWCLLRPSLVIELVESAGRLEEANARLARIVAIIDGTPSTDTAPARIGALQHWTENQRAKLRALLYEIRGLALSDIEP